MADGTIGLGYHSTFRYASHCIFGPLGPLGLEIESAECCLSIVIIVCVSRM